MTTHRLGRRGALDVRGLEAGRRAHGARVPLRARDADRLGPAVQHLRPGPDRRRRDPRVHRGRARRAATRRSTATGRRSARGATSTTWSRRSCSRWSIRSAVGESFNVGNPRSAVTIYDLAQRDQAADRLPGRDPFQSHSTTRTSSCASRMSTRRGAARLRSRRSSSTRASSGRSRGTASGSARPRMSRGVAPSVDPARASGRGRGRARGGRPRWSRAASSPWGRKVAELRAGAGRVGRHGRSGRRLVRAPRRSISPCWRSGSGRATR